MASRLPENPSLERLRAEARQLQRAVRAGNTDAAARITTWHPAPTTVLRDRNDFRLADAQVSVARQYGLSGWPQLVRYVEHATTLGRDPVDDEPDLPVADRFCLFACLRYDGADSPPRWATARSLYGELPTPHVWAAAAAADVAAVRGHLAADPGLANTLGGPWRWPPLLYLTYSRLLAGPDVDTGPDTAQAVCDTARVLVAAGADPNAGCLWRGLATPFTALTGVFGEGEQGPGRQPRHPHALPLATVLLDAGAEANDAQSLYNRMFRPDDDHLELLFEYGLGQGNGGPWRRLLGEATESVPEMMVRQLGWAADHGFTDRLTLFARHGWGERTTLQDGRSVAEHLVEWERARRDLPPVNVMIGGRTRLHDAAWEGDLGLIEELLAAGADPTIVDDDHGTTPLQWAEHAYQPDAAALLRNWPTS